MKAVGQRGFADYTGANETYFCWDNEKQLQFTKQRETDYIKTSDYPAIASTAGVEKDFLVSQLPVTNGDWLAFVRAGGYDTSKPWWNDLSAYVGSDTDREA